MTPPPLLRGPDRAQFIPYRRLGYRMQQLTSNPTSMTTHHKCKNRSEGAIKPSTASVLMLYIHPVDAESPQ